MADLVLAATMRVRPTGEMPDGHVEMHQDAYDAITELQSAVRPLGSTPVGLAVLSATDAAAARSAIGAGTSSLALGTAAGTAAAGNDARLGDARVPVAHTHTASQVSDLVEFIQDAVAAMLVAGSNVTLGYDDALGRVTITAAASGGTGGTTDPEIVRDTIGAALVAGSGIQVLVNDAGDTISIAVTGAPISAVTGLQAALDAKAATSHTHTAAQLSDATATGRSLLTATDTTAARDTVGLGGARVAAVTESGGVYGAPPANAPVVIFVGSGTPPVAPVGATYIHLKSV